MQETTSERCALVTGSSNGIGEAIVKQLAQLGYKLVVTGRDESDIKRVAAECAKLSPKGLKPLEVVANLEQEADIERLFKESMKHFNNKLHLLVNNAGFALPVPAVETDKCYTTFLRTMQINLNAAVRLTLLAAPVLKETAGSKVGDSNIIFIGSIAAIRPTMTLFAYDVSKRAVAAFSENMAVELAPQVRVNCISPGPVMTKIIKRAGFDLNAFTEMTHANAPLKRLGDPAEVANAVTFLADPQKAAFITGADLVIDGGIVLAPKRWDS